MDMACQIMSFSPIHQPCYDSVYNWVETPIHFYKFKSELLSVYLVQ